MKKNLWIALFLTISTTMAKEPTETFIGRNNLKLNSDLMTPEALWAMGRINAFVQSPNEKDAIYGVTYYSVSQNKSHTVLYAYNMNQKESKQLTTDVKSENTPTYINNGKQVLYLSSKSGSNQLWCMNADGTGRQQITNLEDDIEDYLLSPDEKKIILIREVDTYASIDKKYDDLPKASGMVINDMNYKHWDHFVTTIPHPFLADFSLNGISNITDILNNEPYECPMLPFGGTEQLAWSPDSKLIAYTCRKKTGVKYASSTDSDIYIYNTQTGKTTNICKPANYIAPETDDTKSYQYQEVNQQKEDCNVGYDTNPAFSPDGQYIAWQSMERDGYESDRNRLCIYTIASGKKQYVTESFESNVDTYCWGNDSKTLYFTGVWHGTTMVYSTNLKAQVKKLTEGIFDYSIVSLAKDGKSLFVKRHSMSQADEVYQLLLKDKSLKQLTFENKYFYDNLTFGKVQERWIKTIDNKQELAWVIYPPHFDPNKKYPALLFCEGGPQSPVSQFWSYRWNFQIMAANGYIVIAPNRRGLPGFGMEWLEEISGDYAGLCMKDYLSAIDDLAKEPYVDKEHLGCVGASFGGYSVYWLAGHHEKRFKAFIAHDGIFNFHQQWGETEEMWFPNWDLGGAPWNNPSNNAYSDSPHLSVHKWDTPILCIHGMKDYRILNSQGESAFVEARMRGIPAQLLLLPDENHWVLKPQNGILWQRTFFNWLDRWLKK